MKQINGGKSGNFSEWTVDVVTCGIGNQYISAISILSKYYTDTFNGKVF